MTKKEVFFSTTMRRENRLFKFILNGFLSISSLPKLFLEVFIRSHFGMRYFKRSAAITVAVILAIIPPVFNKIATRMLSVLTQEYGYSEPSFWYRYGTWYLAIVAFLYFSMKRWQEIKSAPNTFDFAKLSVFSGRINPRFFFIPIINKRPSVREIECFYEPALFFIIGVVLSYLNQRVGGLLQWCSIFYSFSYIATWREGDNFILEWIDKMILNEQYADAFINEPDPENVKGVTFRMTRPKSSDMRNDIIESLEEEDIAWAE